MWWRLYAKVVEDLKPTKTKYFKTILHKLHNRVEFDLVTKVGTLEAVFAASNQSTYKRYSLRLLEAFSSAQINF